MKLETQRREAYKTRQRLVAGYKTKIRTRATEDGGETGGIGFVGHSAVFNTRTYIGSPPWGFFEEIHPRAFDSAIARPDDVRMLSNHRSELLLARTASGTLRLSTDADGEVTDAEMADVSYARDLAVLMERGDLTQMSFAFIPDDEDWSEITIKDEASGTELKADLVTVKDLTQFDVSPVTFPAYEDTDAGLRLMRRGAETDARFVRAMMTLSGSFDPWDLDRRELDLLERMARPLA